MRLWPMKRIPIHLTDSGFERFNRAEHGPGTRGSTARCCGGALPGDATWQCPRPAIYQRRDSRHRLLAYCGLHAAAFIVRHAPTKNSAFVHFPVVAATTADGATDSFTAFMDNTLR